MRCFSFPTQCISQTAPHLYRQLLDQLRQWIVPQDQRHLQNFTEIIAVYGQRFGGIEPHFKDYKSAAFEIVKSRLRDATALTWLVMLLDCASLLAVVLGMMVVRWEQRYRIDGHAQRGLSFLPLGLRDLKQRWYNDVLLPPLRALPRCQPPHKTRYSFLHH